MSDSNRAIPEPVYVSETLLKKRKANEKGAAIKAKERLELRKTKKQLKKTQFKRADEFIRRHRLIEKQGKRLRVLAKGHRKGANQKGDGKLLFVIRMKTESSIHPRIRKILSQVGLLKMNTGVFVVCNDATVKDLQKIEPYVTYGSPSLKTVRDLIMKRGATRINGVRTPLSDNAMIEEALGEYGIICLEDIIHEILEHGEHFEAVSKFLTPFKLNDPVKGWRQKKLKEIMDRENEEEDAEDDINKLVETMN
ncbi:ribosomal protein L30, ferredoxin-like fold domain-containing protein [Cokeromyces recurvatus]|uniref:ribosomal protein L30, ferredoxin-like fold domain-containing protein n=1 Tax=Cokeromyces recurvatus TaxID=90255 RepID=UPI00221E5372|nr:ribosomal protein L30, ferredoxin-like fold domain-containing protein [Cokeromyces recurvatus]KAI7906709.1 ribosomal protein L30, ferredoxin-like fold domain-containing protein [Cokeromyces recurvatus]